MRKVHSNLVKNLKEFFTKTDLKRAVIGLSGGVDSAVSLKLCIDAIGVANVTAVLMPETGLSTQTNLDDARNLCKSWGVQYDEIDIKPILKVFDKLPWIQNDLAQMNLRSRIRAVILYNYSNSNKTIVVGTSNKSEFLMGYFTKYGDGAVDVEVIGDLYKTEVYELAQYLKLPKHFITKKPSAELVHGQTDEDELGIDYKSLDEILIMIFDKKVPDDNLIKKGIRPETLRHIKERHRVNMHKTKSPPIIKAR